MIRLTPKSVPCCGSFGPPRFMGAALPIVLLVFVFGVSASRAQEASLPKAETILDEYVEATGGKAAYDKLQNRVAEMSVELPSQGLKVDMTMYTARPNKMYAVSEAEMFGKIERGTDGNVVWEITSMTGPQLKEGEERTVILRGAVFDPVTAWRELFMNAECVGTEVIDGKSCFKVTMIPTEGDPETRYYDKVSHLLVRTDMDVDLPTGTVPMQTYVSDFKQVDGVLFSHKTRVVMMGHERIVTTDSLKHNVDLPPDRFTIPDEIKALIEHQNAEKAKTPAPSTSDPEKKTGTGG